MRFFLVKNQNFNVLVARETLISVSSTWKCRSVTLSGFLKKIMIVIINKTEAWSVTTYSLFTSFISLISLIYFFPLLLFLTKATNSLYFYVSNFSLQLEDLLSPFWPLVLNVPEENHITSLKPFLQSSFHFPPL